MMVSWNLLLCFKYLNKIYRLYENNNNKYICVSNELNIDYDTFIADSVENAKKQVEGMLLDHWKEQIVYLEDCIDLLQNKEE